MIYICALIAIIFVAIILLLDLPLHLITWLIEKAKPGACTNFRHGYVRFAVKVIWLLVGGKTTVIGQENIPSDGPVVFIGNHRSNLDPIVALAYIKKPVGFIAKNQLESTPIALIMREIHCLFLDREDARKGLKTILTAIDYVKGGVSMFVFPEGTRNKENDELLPFHAGSFKIATKAKAPIVPVTLVNTGSIFRDGKLRRVPVVIEFGAPIETENMGRDEQKELPDLVRNLILETYKRNSESI